MDDEPQNSESNGKSKFQLPKWLGIRHLIGLAVGLASGYAYYYFVGCQGGACPLKSNPYYMLALGGLSGYLIADLFRKKTTK